MLDTLILVLYFVITFAVGFYQMGMHFTQVGHPTPPPVVVQRGRLRRFS
jgi:hypothetical protein